MNKYFAEFIGTFFLVLTWSTPKEGSISRGLEQ